MTFEKKKISDFAKVITGGTPSTLVKEYWDGGTIPWLNSGELNQDIITNTDNFITKAGLESSSAKLMPADSVLVALTGATTGKTGYLTFEACGNQSVTGILPSEKHHPKYLYYYISSIRAKIMADSYGGAQKHISQDYVKNIVVPLPALSVQREIAAILDRADMLRQKDQQLLQKYDELAQSIFYDMFGDPVKNEKGWEVRDLNDVCLQITDGTHFSPPSTTHGIPYITAKHLKYYGIDFDLDPTYISKEDHAKIYSRCSPKNGDVLYIKDGATTGIAAINYFNFEFSMLSSLALLKPDPRLLTNYFLTYWLNNSQIKNSYIHEFLDGAAITRFTLKKIKSFKILLPPLTMQTKFSEVASKIKFLRDKQVSITNYSSDIFSGLLNKYFVETLKR